ncbi:putative cytochrome c [Variovorax paradoxus B4]|uniref:Putative cytochrome c n=1 Tax=Variovorax paradoxus B4 TaxID=1246301 RepID=T1XG18_VARPD|nr:cytochrome c [Variovorax paradoxus]AGU51862.1 putative cytochrome c [Variovorax paradoxus B4]
MKKNKAARRFAAIALLLLGHGIFAMAAAPATPAALSANGIEQRVAACIACHGREGATTNAGYFPRLSGKPAGYLFNQLRSFRDGRRFNADMSYMVQHLSDAYLMEMAEYFADLDLPYPPVSPASDAPAAQLARGRQLALEGDAARRIPACVQCHGAALTGVQPAIPGLLGLPRLYVSSQLGAWLTSERHALAPDCMADIGRRMTTADINAVASWLAVQPMPADPKPAASLPAALPMHCGGMPK